jgi:glycosyltransferase involved in cell wall biosynthesis
MTVGFYSPLPPARTGVADYSAALLAELRRHGKVAVSPSRCDAALYHLGNNQLHAAIYRRALTHPGVIVLHDAVLNHFFLGQLSEAAYIEEFVYNYGAWNRSLGRDLWRGRATSGSDERYFRHPMLRRVAERARAIVVHNAAAAATVREHATNARIVELPHFFAAPALPDEVSALRYRQALGVPLGSFLFGIFGYLRESKRVSAILHAFAAIHAELPRTALLIAGQFVSSDLERAVAPMLHADGVFRLPYLKERDFWLAARTVDACINLRYPAAGEASGIAVRMMGIGKPVMVTEGLETAGIPDDACVRIPSGIGERDSLRQHMVLLTSISGVAQSLGRQGARHVAAQHGLERIGRQYWDVLCESCT